MRVKYCNYSIEKMNLENCKRSFHRDQSQVSKPSRCMNIGHGQTQYGEVISNHDLGILALLQDNDVLRHDKQMLEIPDCDPLTA